MRQRPKTKALKKTGWRKVFSPKIAQKNSFSKAHMVAFVLVFAAIGGFVLLSSKAAGSTANLWIDSNGGTCTRSSSPVAYNDASACSTMQAAMTAAQGGDIVIMKAGTYPAQTISSGTKSSTVSFYAESYAQAVTATDAYSATTDVYISSLNLSGVDKIHIYGIQATPTPDNSRADARLTYAGGGDLDICSSGCTASATTDILIDGFHGRSAFIRATGVTIDHSSFGGWDACYDTSGNHLASGNSGTEDGFRFWDGTGGSGTPTNSTVRNSVFHDIIMGVNDGEENSVCTFGSSNGPHADCMQNNGGNNITVEANIFFNCPSSDIQWNPFSGATLGTQLIQNNYFGSIGGTGNGTVLGGQGSGWDCSGITVRNNYYNNSQGINPGGGCTAGSINIYGNIFKNGSCSGVGVNYHDNVFQATGCGTNPRTCTPTFVSAPAPGPDWLATSVPDFHLASNDTCAIDHGYTSYPATDFEGDARPQGAAADAGPDEYKPSANIWMSTSGNDSTCARDDQSHPCLTLSKAYSLAQNGDVIEIAGGTYNATSWGSGCAYGGDGCVKYNSAITTSVTVRPAAGQNVIINGSYDLQGVNHLVVDGQNRWTQNGAIGVVPLNGSACGSTAGDITLRNMVWHGPFTFNNVQGATIDSVDIGGFSYPDGGTQDSWGDSSRISNYTCNMPTDLSRNITFNNLTFHNIYRGDSASHAECLFVHESDNVTIQNSKFLKCPVFDVFLADSNVQNHLTIQNNIMTVPCPDYNDPGKPSNVVLPGGGQTDCGGDAIKESNITQGNPIPTSNWIFRYNSMGGDAFLSLGSNSYNSTDQFYGNIVDSLNGNDGGCSAGTPAADWSSWTIGYNVITGGPACSGTDVTSTTATEYTNYSTDNYQIKTGAKAINLVPTSFASGCPLTDYSLTIRPQGGACDAGAYEFASSGDSTPPTVSLTAPNNGATVSSNVSLTATANDDVAVANVAFKVDGTTVNTDTSSPYSYSWDSTSVSNGSHTISVVATDTNGNSSTTSSVTVTVSNTLQLGNANVLANADNNIAGTTEAFSAVAPGTGQVNQLNVYIDTGNTASTLTAGIYSDTSGHAGSLLGSGSVSISGTGWKTVTLGSNVSLSSGQTYWIAILGTGGTLRYRDTAAGTASTTHNAGSLSSLPATWTVGDTYSNSPISAYATYLSSGIPGDLNSDGHVTIVDLSIMLSHYGTSGTASQGDCNNDGTINIVDLSILLSHYGV